MVFVAYAIFIAFLSVLVIGNAKRAKMRGLHSFLWGFYTVAAYFICKLIGWFVVVLLFCRDVVNMEHYALLGSKAREAIQQQLTQALIHRPLAALTIELIGFGGYLLIRYMIEKKMGESEPEMHLEDSL